jgi:hypothetical protein
MIFESASTNADSAGISAAAGDPDGLTAPNGL